VEVRAVTAAVSSSNLARDSAAEKSMPSCALSTSTLVLATSVSCFLARSHPTRRRAIDRALSDGSILCFFLNCSAAHLSSASSMQSPPKLWSTAEPRCVKTPPLTPITTTSQERLPMLKTAKVHAGATGSGWSRSYAIAAATGSLMTRNTLHAAHEGPSARRAGTPRWLGRGALT